MSLVGEAVADYLAIRRALGFKLVEHQRLLRDFVAFLEQSGTETITTFEVGRQRRREVVLLSAARYDEMLEREDLVRDPHGRLPEPHRAVAWDLLEHLRDAPQYGKPLDAHAMPGDLSAARALYVIDFERKQIDLPPPYRIVYRLLPSEARREKAQVIWAGRRDDLEVYRVAARRLARQR